MSAAPPQPSLAPEPRPGIVRRAAAGAWQVPAAIVFLLRKPRLWLVAALPAAITGVLVVVGVGLGFYAFTPIDIAVAPEPGRIPSWLGFALTVTLGMATVSIGILLGLFLGLGLSAPLLEWLSRQAETLLAGGTIETRTGMTWELLQAFRGVLSLLVAAPIVVVLGLMPILGPIASTLWGAHAVSFGLTDGTLTRHGLSFSARRAWHRRFRVESLGFGLAALVILPFGFLIAAPVLTIGATRLVIELERAHSPRSESATPKSTR